jgi:hypothetical protein
LIPHNQFAFRYSDHARHGIAFSSLTGIAGGLRNIIITLSLTGSSLLAGVILHISQKRIAGLVTGEVEKVAENNGKEIQAWLDLYMDAARTIAQIMEQYEQIPAAQRRTLFDMMLKTMVEKNPEITAASSCWEANALDGMDGPVCEHPRNGSQRPVYVLLVPDRRRSGPEAPGGR